MVHAVENLPSHVGNVGFIPAWGTKTPYAAGQLSWSIATTDPMAWSLCIATREACCNYRPHVPQVRPEAAE